MELEQSEPEKVVEFKMETWKLFAGYSQPEMLSKWEYKLWKTRKKSDYNYRHNGKLLKDFMLESINPIYLAQKITIVKRDKSWCSLHLDGGRLDENKWMDLKLMEKVELKIFRLMECMNYEKVLLLGFWLQQLERL